MTARAFSTAVIAALKGHPDEILCFAMACLAFGLKANGETLADAIALPGVFYAAYMLISLYRWRERLRESQAAIRRLEQERREYRRLLKATGAGGARGRPQRGEER